MSLIVERFGCTKKNYIWLRNMVVDLILLKTNLDTKRNVKHLKYHSKVSQVLHLCLTYVIRLRLGEVLQLRGEAS